MPHVQAANPDAVKGETDGHRRHADLRPLEDAHRPLGKAQPENFAQMTHHLAKSLPARESVPAALHPDIALEEHTQLRRDPGADPSPARYDLLVVPLGPQPDYSPSPPRSRRPHLPHLLISPDARRRRLISAGRPPRALREGKYRASGAISGVRKFKD